MYGVGEEPIYLETASAVAKILEEMFDTVGAALLLLGVAILLWCISAKL